MARLATGDLSSASNGSGMAWSSAVRVILAVSSGVGAAATTWLRAGMPLAETTRRLGRSVESLVSTYVGALDDEEHVSNQRVDTIIG